MFRKYLVLTDILDIYNVRDSCYIFILKRDLAFSDAFDKYFLIKDYLEIVLCRLVRSKDSGEMVV